MRSVVQALISIIRILSTRDIRRYHIDPFIGNKSLLTTLSINKFIYLDFS